MRSSGVCQLPVWSWSATSSALFVRLSRCRRSSNRSSKEWSSRAPESTLQSFGDPAGAAAAERGRGATDRALVCDQHLAGLVPQLLKSRGSDADGQGFGPGFQVARALSLQGEHDLPQVGLSPSVRLHPWPAEARAQVRPDTGNRPGVPLPPSPEAALGAAGGCWAGRPHGQPGSRRPQ
jgi:hypothetical protein